MTNNDKLYGFDKDGVPLCLNWDVNDVVEWIEDELHFPQYKECFARNFISGKKLITMEASNLPKIGITDFEHIKIISEKIRELLAISYPYWNRRIDLPPRDNKELFIERKSKTGAVVNLLTYEEHLRYLREFQQHGVPKSS